jgi:hypothetical protein
MIRTIISLNANEKKWLDKMAKAQHLSMAQIIRNAIKEYRQKHSNTVSTDIDSLLQETKGIWEGEEGLK